MRTIAHISDLHFGRVDWGMAEVLAGDLEGMKPTVVVVSGDLTQRGRRGQYAEAAGYLGRLPGARIVVPGNHDIPLFDVVRRFFFPLNRYRQYISRELGPVYRDEELLVMGMNTARSFAAVWNGFWKEGRISEKQLMEVKRMAEEEEAGKFKVVVTHHPFIPPPGERRYGVVGGAGRALDVMERCGIDMLLAGHLHMGYSGDVRTHYESVERSIISVQAGTAISTRRRGEANAYNFITIEPGQVTVAVRTWNGKKFESTAATRYPRSGHLRHSHS